MAYDFDKIASAYDRFNHLSTFGIDRLWRLKTVAEMADADKALSYLDVATGTGDLAQALLRKAHHESRLTGIDLSENMMDVARRKLRDDSKIKVPQGQITLQHGDAERMPFADASFDRVTVGFGVRNFVHLQQGLNEMCRVLRPGGRLAVLELSYPDNRFLFWCYKLYALRFIPWLGERLSHDRAAYEYLPQSILRFPKPAQFIPMLCEAGFGDVQAYSLTFGICRLYVATK